MIYDVGYLWNEIIIRLYILLYGVKVSVPVGNGVMLGYVYFCAVIENMI